MHSSIDTTQLSKQLAAGDNPIVVFKDALQLAEQKLDAAFLQAAPIDELIMARAEIVDQILGLAWQQLNWGELGSRICLVAVGGYGRGELHPRSDIDLLILVADNIADKVKDKLASFITLLWDIKLDIGQSVRTVDECQQQAADDVTVVTALMESRLLIGPTPLFNTMLERITPQKVWQGASFFKAKWDEQVARHRRFKETEYNLEPNVKSAPGGLRDIQMVAWVAKRHFNANSLKGLADNGFLTPVELLILQSGQEFLWKVRYGLHMLAGRSEDRLLFEYQKQLATIFGYQDSDEMLAVEHFMRHYYRMALRLAELNELLLHHFDDAILKANQQKDIVKINPRFQLVNNYIDIKHAGVFKQTPSALLEIFSLMAENPSILGATASSIRALRDDRVLIDDEFRSDETNIAYFMSILRSENGVYKNLRRMKRFGILGLYLPEFGHIIGQMQFDLFHIYTVDAHTLQLVKNLRRFRYHASTEKFPIAGHLIHKLPKLELVYIAALYHDIAKGRGGDHSELGMSDARAFCERHGISLVDTKLVVWLVRNHLIMSTTAQRQDLSDPDVLNSFAEFVGNPLYLDYLYALTVADIYATNPTLWTSWRASLMRQLYSGTLRALKDTRHSPIEKADLIQQTQQQAIALLTEQGITEERIWGTWDNPGAEYFLRETAVDIAWHTMAVINQTDPESSLVLIKETSNREFEGGTQIFLHTHNRPKLFSTVAKVMESLNLSIQSARIITSASDNTLNTYVVLNQNDEPIGDDEKRIQRIQHTLVSAIDNGDSNLENNTNKSTRRLRSFRMPTQVKISEHPDENTTVLEVLSIDRPGLLATIGNIFVQFNLTLHDAKITTLGERVEDVFTITTQDNKVLQDQSIKQQLAKVICDSLDKTV